MINQQRKCIVHIIRDNNMLRHVIEGKVDGKGLK